MKKAGLLKPFFDFDNHNFSVLIESDKIEEKTRVKTRVKIIGLIKQNSEITREELSVKIDISIKGIEWNLAKLKQKNLLKRIGPAKGGHWEIIK